MSTPKASDAGVWVHCQASVRLSRLFPDLDPDSPERVEGREWHAAAEALLRDGEVVGTPAMQEGAQLYAETLKGLAPIEAWHVEEVVDLSKVHSFIPHGRPDAWCYHDGWLRSADYKPGHGYVDEWENWQQLLYLCALFDRLVGEGVIPNTPEAEDSTRVSVTIVQPRYYGRHGPVRTRNMRASQLRAYRNMLEGSAALTLKGDAPAKTGEHCSKCPARRGCGTLQEATLRVVDLAGHTSSVDPTPELVGHELQTLHAAQQLLKARADALEEQALHHLAGGREVAGYEMGETQTRETWQSGKAEDVLRLGAILGVDLALPPAPVTPAQARKRGIDAAVISAYSHRPAGARKLMPADPTITLRIFNNG